MGAAHAWPTWLPPVSVAHKRWAKFPNVGPKTEARGPEEAPGVERVEGLPTPEGAPVRGDDEPRGGLTTEALRAIVAQDDRRTDLARRAAPGGPILTLEEDEELMSLERSKRFSLERRWNEMLRQQQLHRSDSTSALDRRHWHLLPRREHEFRGHAAAER